MDNKKRNRSIILIVLGALLIAVPLSLFSWLGFFVQIAAVYGLLQVFQPQMNRPLQIVLGIVGGLVLATILTVIWSFLLYP